MTIEPNYYPIGANTTAMDSGGMDINSTPNMNQDSITPDMTNIAEAPNGTVMRGGQMQSPNYATGVSGWIIRADGSVEFGNGYFRGDITGASGTFSGTISATAGFIGGFVIGADYIRDVANTFGLASTVTGSDDVRFWAGDSYANRAAAPFRVLESGAVYATKITVTGQTTSFVQVPLTQQFTAGEAISASNALYLSPNYSGVLVRASSQCFTAADSSSLSITGDISIQIWIKLTNLPSAAGGLFSLVAKQNAGQYSWRFFISNSDDKIYFQWYNNGGGSANGSSFKTTNALTSGDTGVWMHWTVAVNVDGVDAIFYRDGASVSTTSVATAASAIYDGTALVSLGAEDNGTTGFFNGKIDDVRVWDKTLTSGEISANYNLEIPGSTANLKAYWKLNNRLEDSTSNGNTLTNVGTATFSNTDVPFTFYNVYKAQADVTGQYEGFIGFALANISEGSIGNVCVGGVVPGFTSIVPGVQYYLSDTAGAVSTSAGSNTRKVAIGFSTTELLITNIW